MLLFIGSAAAFAWVNRQAPLEPKPPQNPAPWVEVLQAEPRTFRLDVHSQGIVTPHHEIDLVAEVSGKIIQLHESMVAGGFFAKGDLLAVIDPQDYDYAIAKAEAGLAEAKRLLAQELAQVDQARNEWKALGDGEATPLALHQPQLAEARARLKASEAELIKAKLQRSRCELRAAFAGRVREKVIGLGQYIQAGTKLAHVYGTEIAEIRLPLPLDQLAYLDLPLDNSKPGPKVSLNAELAGIVQHWQGRIVRTEGILDQNTGLIHAVAQVKNPYAKGQPPLLAGLFVQAEIEGVDRSDLFVLPSAAVNSMQEALTVDAENRLHVRKLEILRNEPGQVWIKSGLASGDKVVVEGIQVPVEGIQVQIKPNQGRS